MKHLAPTSLQHFVSEQSSAASEHCPGVVDAEVVEVDPEVDEVVASAQVGTSNTITQVELVVLASIGHHNVTIDSETQQTMIKSRWEKNNMTKLSQPDTTNRTHRWTSSGLCPSLSAEHLPHGATHN